VLSISCKILSNTLLSNLSQYVDEIIAAHQCGFRHEKSIADQIFCICNGLEKKLEYNETEHKLFIKLKQSIIQLGGRCIIFSKGFGCPWN
jgi:hypothetical protein